MPIKLKSIKHPLTSENIEVNKNQTEIKMPWHSGAFEFEIEVDGVHTSQEYEFRITLTNSTPATWSGIEDQRFRQRFDYLDPEQHVWHLFLRIKNENNAESTYPLRLTSPFTKSLKNVGNKSIDWFSLPKEYLLSRGPYNEIVRQLRQAEPDQLHLIHGPISSGKSTSIRLVKEKLKFQSSDPATFIMVDLNVEDIRRIFTGKQPKEGKNCHLRSWIEYQILKSFWDHCHSDDVPLSHRLSIHPSVSSKDQWFEQPTQEEYQHNWLDRQWSDKLNKLTGSPANKFILVFFIDELDRLDTTLRNEKQDATMLLKELIWGVSRSFLKRDKDNPMEKDWCSAIAIVAAERNDYQERWTEENLYLNGGAKKSSFILIPHQIELFSVAHIGELIDKIFDDIPMIKQQKSPVTRYIQQKYCRNPLLTVAYLHSLFQDWSVNRNNWELPAANERIEKLPDDSMLSQAHEHILSKSSDSGITSDRLDAHQKRVYINIVQSINPYTPPSVDVKYAEQLVAMVLVQKHGDPPTYRASYCQGKLGK